MVRKLIACFLGLLLLVAAVATFDFDIFKVRSQLGVQSGASVTSANNKVVPRALSLVCPGPAFIDQANRAGASRFAQIGSAQVNVNQNSASNFFTVSKPKIIRVNADVTGQSQGSSLLSANQTQLIGAAANGYATGANGLIGADCVRPSSDFWFLGASTAVGRQALLIVQNPSQVDATFAVELFDEGGKINASGTQGLAVMAGKSLVVPLAAFAPSDPSLTVHISSQGGAVAAWVQQKTVRGTIAAGIDFISPSSSAAQTQVLPGLTIAASKAAAEISKANPDYSDLAPVVRLFVPEVTAGTATSTSVTILVSGIDSKTFGTVVRQDIAVGQSTDVALTGLADGKYSVEVTADKPLFASMKVSANSRDPAKVLTSTGSDFTWISAAEPITTMRNFMVPATGFSSLNIANDSRSETTVIVKDITHGKTKTYVLPQSGIIDSPTHAGDNLQISATSKVYANLTTTRDNGIAALKILDAKNLGGQVEVSLH